MEWRSLPGDMVEEILSRVPAKFLARLRSTSKQWNALLKSGSFATKHSANARKESVVIMLIHSRVCLVKINLRAPSIKVAIAAPFYFNDPLFTSSQVDIRNVFHCDGLLLCTTTDNRLVVWNPCSGETKWIKPRESYKKSDSYALGYDNKSSCKEYKILRVDRRGYEIYDFTSNSWRVLCVAIDWFLVRSRRGISVKGNTYWFATQERTSHAESLLSFDFSTEKFQNLSLPHPHPHPFPYVNATLSVIGEEQLCLLGTNRKHWIFGNSELSNFKVWVATSTGSVMSWSKLFASSVVMYLSPNNILHILGEDKHILENHHPGGDSTTYMPSCSVLLNYVPSLAQIQ